MATKKYENILDTFDEIAEKTQDGKIDSIVEWVRTSVEEVHKPTIALTSFNLNHTERFQIIKQFFGVEIPKEIVEMIDGEPICLILDYNDFPTLLNEQRNIGRQILFGLPFEALKELRIAICDEIQMKSEWLELSNEIDMVCLVINATMAMNQMERTWLKECAISFFEENELVLAFTRLEQMNEDEDVQIVHKVVDDSLKLLGVSPKVFENVKESLDWMILSIKNENIQEKHAKRVVKNGINVMSNLLEELINSAVVDSEAIQYAIEQLEKQQNRLELAGQFAAESILSNAMNRLKFQLCDGIRDYGRQMTVNIRKKVEDSSIDQLETMDDKINGYVSGSWEYYIKSMSAKIETEMKTIDRKLTSQMEADADMLISGLDESAKRTVHSALIGLTFGQMDTAGLPLLNARTMIYDRNALAEISVGTITDQLRKETRNMMLLSIPLFFVNPLLSLGNIFVSKTYGKFKADSELKDIRAEMVKQIEKICFDHAELIVHQVELSFDNEIRIGSAHVQSAYHNLILQIENSMVELNNSREAKVALKRCLNDQITVVFPSFLANL